MTCFRLEGASNLAKHDGKYLSNAFESAASESAQAMLKSAVSKNESVAIFGRLLKMTCNF